MEKVNVKERQDEIKVFNSKNKFIKRGIAVSSMKYPWVFIRNIKKLTYEVVFRIYNSLYNIIWL